MWKPEYKTFRTLSQTFRSPHFSLHVSQEAQFFDVKKGDSNWTWP